MTKSEKDSLIRRLSLCSQEILACQHEILSNSIIVHESLLLDLLKVSFHLEKTIVACQCDLGTYEVDNYDILSDPDYPY